MDKVAVLDQYTLRFKGLSAGTHRFEYVVDDAFFAEFPESEISHGTVQVEVEVSKQPSLLTLDFRMQGSVEVACDRCLGEFRMPVDYSGRLLVKFTEEPPESDGDIVWLHPVEGELNLSQYIYESIVLSLPFQRIHPLDAQGNPTCDPEMLRRFRIVTGDEFDAMFPGENVDTEAQNEAQADWERQLAAVKAQMEKNSD
jgi:uncharacterized metal-binding protein YceD (DUF177 family)